MLLCTVLQWLVTCKDFKLPEDGSNQVAETCRSNLNNNKLINEKLICVFRWSVLPSTSSLFSLCCFVVFLYYLTPEDGTDILSRNVGTEVPFYSA